MLNENGRSTRAGSYNSTGLATGPELKRNRQALAQVKAALTDLVGARTDLVDGDDISKASEELSERISQLVDVVERDVHDPLDRRVNGKRAKRRPNPPVVQQALEAKRREDIDGPGTYVPIEERVRERLRRREVL